MNKLRHPAYMLLAGTLAGFISGAMKFSIVGIRGAAFGFCLTLAVCIVQRRGWNLLVYLPGLLLGIILGFFPPDLLGELGSGPPAYDILTLLNCTLAIPAFCWAYVSDRWKGRIWKMLMVGFFSCLLRSLSMEQNLQSLVFTVFNFPIGMLPFLALWLGTMRLTDPKFNVL